MLCLLSHYSVFGVNYLLPLSSIDNYSFMVGIGLGCDVWGDDGDGGMSVGACQFGFAG